jgi:hypothetical protein
MKRSDLGAKTRFATIFETLVGQRTIPWMGLTWVAYYDSCDCINSAPISHIWLPPGGLAYVWYCCIDQQLTNAADHSHGRLKL